MAEGFEGGQNAVKDKLDSVTETVTDKAGEVKAQASEKAKEIGQTAKDKALEFASTGKNRLADSIDSIGDRIDERISVLEQQGGMVGRAAPIAQKASTAVDATAQYLRNNELDAMRDDLVEQIRERPLMSVGIAFGAGVVLGQMFGGSSDEDEDRDRKSRKRRKSSGRGRSLIKSQISGPLGAALVSSFTHMLTTQIRERIAGAGTGTGDDTTETNLPSPRS